MTKYRVIYDYSDGTSGPDSTDELFDTEEEAHEAGQYGCSCYDLGGEILHMSNPGDYPLDEDDGIDYHVEEVED